MSGLDKGKALTEEMLPVGEPIPWDLCNRQGRVVFRKGFVINTAASRERVLGMNLTVADVDTGSADQVATESSAEASLQSHTIVGPLRMIDQLADRISELFIGICKGPLPEAGAIDALMSDVIQLCNAHSDTCLAAVHFNHGRSYQALHGLYSLFLARQLAHRLDYDESRSLSLAGAALTANLGIFEFHDEWASQRGGLTEEQNRIRLDHPVRSVERLSGLGVTDPVWLEIVRQHHEMLDGSGYPRGLSGAQVLEEAMIVGLVDRYLAWVLPRVDRGPTLPAKILQGIYKDADKYGKSLVQQLVKVVGIYPPGTPVELASGELAVVVRRNLEDTAHPLVAVVRQQDDRFSREQPLRDTRENSYRIVEAIIPARGDPHPALMIQTWR